MTIAPAPAPFTVSIPRLETERLRLREYRREDLDAYIENHADPVATEYVGGVLDRRAAWRLFLGNAGSWVVYGFGWWAVEERASGAVCGIVGVFVRDGHPSLEAGWTIYGPFHRRGFATEAARAALDYAFDVRGATRVVALVAPGNAASAGVARRLGMRFEEEMTLYDRSCHRYALER
jgi:RimJ/RimL family protein N-acetyltransferase